MTKILALGFLCFLLAQATQEIRIDTFDKKSNRTGYIIIDPKTKRFDTYDTKSHRTGWGTITRESGDVQVFDKDGNRIGSGTLPAASVKR